MARCDCRAGTHSGEEGGQRQGVPVIVKRAAWGVGKWTNPDHASYVDSKSACFVNTHRRFESGHPKPHTQTKGAS